jgi:transglutaminase-like putative cysteine protease
VVETRTGDDATTELDAVALAQEPVAPEEAAAPEPTVEPPLPAGRLGAVVAFSTIAAAVMVGGIYLGVSPRVFGGLAGVLGVVLALRVRLVRQPVAMNLLIVAGIAAIGILMAAPAGSFGDVINIGPFVREAVTSGDVLRPPVQFTLGWHAIIGWLMAGVGFAAAWVAVEMKRPSLGLLVPVPIVLVSAISVPKDAKLGSGLVCLALFAVGLGLLSGIELTGDMEQRSLAFELRRGLRALPLIGAVTVGLYFLSQLNLLFPPPLYDPTKSAQKPKTVPLSKVPDRVLFTVQSSVTGPWRMGGLDVYDGKDWRLPPFSENRLAEVPRSGIVDNELQRGIKATFDVKDLGGAVLPGLPNLVGVVAEKAPPLSYDTRTGNIRLSQGQVQPGLVYSVTAARIPAVEELRNVNAPPPKDVQKYTEIPSPPSAVQDLLRRAPSTSLWDKLDFLRNELLHTVAATGAGTPVSMPPSRVAEMLTTRKEGSPYEIVAAQAMLARWAGIPARIGYGFDGGDKIGDVYEVRPKHGASFIEVYFPGYKWLPIIGSPLLAKSSFSGQTQLNQTVQPSEDIAVRVFVPFETNPRSYLFQQIRAVLVVVLPLILFLLLLYFTWPAGWKAYLRSRRRSWALNEGAPARVALAYAEWRDWCTDFGYRHPADTPLMFLDRVVPDEEHAELAWLVTRTLWGDLRGELSDRDADAAEALSRALRRRLAQAHPWTLRSVAALSRLSLRQPYAPALGIGATRPRELEARAA